MKQYFDIINRLMTIQGGEFFYKACIQELCSLFSIQNGFLLRLNRKKTELFTEVLILQNKPEANRLLNTAPEKFPDVSQLKSSVLEKNFGESYPELSGALMPTASDLMLIPIISGGKARGLIGLLGDLPESLSPADTDFLDCIASISGHEWDHDDVEKMLLQSGEEVGIFSTAVRQLHELACNPYSRSEFLERCIATGKNLFGMSTGFVCISYKGRLKIESFQGTNEILPTGAVISPSQEFKAVIENGKTAHGTLDTTRVLVTAGMDSLNYLTYIATPITVDKEVYGLLVFTGDKSVSKKFKKHDVEIMELMAANIGYEIHRSASLDKINKMKIQQDGDYYLTALLINPLATIKHSQSNIDIQMFVKQKKQFSFRKRDAEIGGDICIAAEITLRNKKYISFINADAMGKSIQGAGGSLILGSAYIAIINRTNTYAREENQSPESWLKSLISNIQNLFEVFDGSMLITLVTGLLDVQTGLLYFVNAHHPRSVLFRDNTCSFLETNSELMKMGTPGFKQNIQVRLSHLQENDVVFIGSDGREDILLGYDTVEQRIINQDEKLFITLIDNCKGDLSQLDAEYQKTGEYTDDISVLRICFKQRTLFPRFMDEPEAQNIADSAKELRLNGKNEEAYSLLKSGLLRYRSSIPLLNEIISNALILKKYQMASGYCIDYLRFFPGDSKVEIMLQFCLEKNAELDEAIDIGEKIRIRENHVPSSWRIKSLLILVRIYFKQEKTENMKNCMKEAVKLGPKDPQVKKSLKKYFEKIKL